MKKYLLALTILFVLCGLAVIAAAFSPQSPPVTQLLTDPNLEAYVAYAPEITVGPNNLYTIWPEHTVFSPGTNTGDMDLFYASLPGNNTQRIRDAAATTNGQGFTQIGFYRIARGSNGLIYLAWIEPTSAHGSDAFFWKTGMSAPQNLSNHTLTTNGEAGYLYLALDSNNIPHVLWTEKEPTHASIFYWKEGGTTSKISTTTAPVSSFDATRSVALISKNGVTHAMWYDLDATLGWTMNHWQSNTQTVINMRAGQPSLSDPIHYTYAFVNSSGTFHAVWYEPHYPQPTHIVHWDSTTQTLHTAFSAVNPLCLTPVMDSQGQIHTVCFTSNGPLSHWDSQTLTSVQLTADMGSNQARVVAGKTGNLVFVAWPATDPNWPSHLTDFFYWRPGMAQAQNISDHSQSPADIVWPGFMQLAAADDGTVHIAWEEGRPTYYHSGTNTTTTLNATVTVGYGAGASNSQPDTPYIGHQGAIFRVYNNVAYWFLASTSTSTATPYYLWRSDTGNYTPISAVNGTDSPADHNLRLFWFNRAGQPQLAWYSGVAGEGYNLHYWNSTDGSLDVSDSQNTSGSVAEDETKGATDAYGNVYLVWREGDGDDSDVYAMVKQIEYANHIFVPLVRQ